MNIIQISNHIFIILLTIASIQDFQKKSVSDIIHYLLIVFSISLAIYNIYVQNITETVIFSYLILLFFFIMYLFKYLAIGDLYIMFSLFVFLSNLSSLGILKFLVMLTVGGIFVHCLEAIKIFYRKNEKKKVFIMTLSILISIVAGILYSISLSSIPSFLSLFLISSFLILVPTFILKIYEEQIKKALTFERNVEELVEGDWIDNDIKIKKIPENLLEEIKENFSLEKENDFYIIKLKSNGNKIMKFLILPILFSPFIFYHNFSIFLLMSIFIIFLLTVLHDKIFKDDLGLSKKQIDLLKKIVDKETKFVVKEGAPFVPAMTFAYILSIF